MKCTKCENEIQVGASFCSFCGASAADTGYVRNISLECKQCGGTMTMDEDQNMLECPYCGYKSLIIEDEEVQSKERPKRWTEIFKSRWMSTSLILAVLGIVLTVSALWFFQTPLFRSDASEIDWSILYMGDKIPETGSKLVEIISNTDDWLCMDVYGMPQADFYGYIRECEEQYGFTVDTDKSEYSFEGYTEDGYRLNLYFWDDYMDIDLTAPIQFVEYKLPEYAIREGMPIPNSSLGHFDWNDESGFYLLVGNTTYEEYYVYAEACMDAGFELDRTMHDDYFHGTNEDGCTMFVSYEGNKTMVIGFENPQ